jgi:PadR family transcriptional regulator PadR
MGRVNDILGGSAHLVMAAVVRLKDHAAGDAVRKEIETTTKQPVSIGTVWATLNRLEKAGHLASDVSDRDGRRPKRFYHLTESGQDALVQARQAVDSIWKGMSIRDVKRPSLNLSTGGVSVKKKGAGSRGPAREAR